MCFVKVACCTIASPMKRRAVALLFLSIALPSMAWTRAADQRIAAKSAALAPEDLRLIIKKFNDEYLRGIDDALATEGTDIHRRKLRERIAEQTHTIGTRARGNHPRRGAGG